MHLLVAVAAAETLTFQPGEDWCSAVQAAHPGDTVVLAAGAHAGPCVLSAGGSEGAPVTLRGEPAGAAVLVYSGSSSNVLDVTASHIVIEGLAFGPTNADIDAIKVKAGDHVEVRGNRFSGIGGISVSANSTSTTGLQIVGNTFEDLRATALYLGCHAGAASCVAADVLVAENLVDGVTSPAVGYALEIKADSWGRVRDNVFADAQGPAVEVFGSEDPTAATTVEGNLLVRSRANATLEIGGSHVSARNNVVIGGSGAAVYVYPYGAAVHDVLLEGNTLFGDDVAALDVAASATGITLRGNVAWQAAGDALSGLPGGVDPDANVACASAADCWVDGEGWDFRPVEALRGAGKASDTLGQDFCGVDRQSPPTVGAFEDPERAPGALSVGLKSELGCPALPGGADTADTADTGETDEGGGELECACGHGGAGGAGAVAAAVLLGWNVRRKRG